ncbi:hypothetical protein A1O3_05634 [Capronia epimyces CBS 606.96]|uniref:Uncharacterized protein n=1 Tax=Capronia epimyces CBS 606.96 TaxID=1182542 RepID=W9YRQ8_9EURO|nr:uncharacterized protein A1O3_05634 [Capronia epimyces CBS 606.96]EXJ84959.1 hypothetical protein A1O3_05634 [Capronia epimyces CBS 606.96]
MPSTSKYTSKLAGTAVLIVGGSSGIGFGVAEALVENGVGHIYLSSSQSSKVAAAVERLKAAYPTETAKTTTVTGLTVDLADEVHAEDNVRNLFAQIDRKLDHIVFTAGDALAPSSLDDVTLASARKLGQVRFFGAVLVAKYGSRVLNPGPASSITFTTGAAAEKPTPGWSVIASYASALFGLTRGLALDLKPVRVNLVSPGAVETELWDGFGPAKPEALAQFASKTTTGKVGAVEDVVEGYLFAIKDKNVTGTIIRTDGGLFLV